MYSNDLYQLLIDRGITLTPAVKALVLGGETAMWMEQVCLINSAGSDHYFHTYRSSVRTSVCPHGHSNQRCSNFSKYRKIVIARE